MLLIDSQQYLNLYELHGMNAVLGPLARLREWVFITNQVVDEVNRRKLRVAHKLLTENGLVQAFGAIRKGLPNQFSSGPVMVDLQAKLKAIGDARMDNEIKKAIAELLEQIGRSEDDVSR